MFRFAKFAVFGVLRGICGGAERIWGGGVRGRCKHSMDFAEFTRRGYEDLEDRDEFGAAGFVLRRDSVRGSDGIAQTRAESRGVRRGFRAKHLVAARHFGRKS